MQSSRSDLGSFYYLPYYYYLIYLSPRDSPSFAFDLSVKLNQELGAVAKLTKQVNTPIILQEAAGAQSDPAV